MLELEHKPGTKWPHEAKARAVFLFAEGYGYDRIQEQMRGEYGAAPSMGTLSEWRHDARLSEVIRTLNEEVAIRSSRLLRKAYDYLDERPGAEIVKHILPVNAAGGTAQDKLYRDVNPAQSANVFVIVDARPRADNGPELRTAERPSREIELPAESYESKG